MVDFIKTLPNPVNRDLLLQTLIDATFTDVTMRDSECLIQNVQVGDEATIDSIIANHVASDRTENQQAEQLENLTRDDIRQYLRQQLTMATPDSVSTIVSTIQAFVGSHQGMLNAISRIATLYGYDTETNAGYLRTVYVLVGIFS